jgi:hypothetical protein
MPEYSFCRAKQGFRHVCPMERRNFPGTGRYNRYAT